MERKGHGIALFSGGLDSTLAILMVLQQNVEVTALSFLTHFGCDITDRSNCSHDPYPIAERFGFTVKLIHLGYKFVDLVRLPRFGHGRNMNPCIDCRILMLKEAKEYMEMVGADFVFTGEVLGQRPMSQHRPQLNLVARESGLADRLVRPLSARLLKETEPEKRGLLDRTLLGAMNGRSRKPQMALATRFGLENYPSPAAGCLLTDPEYSRRLRDYFAHHEDADFNELNLLRLGRHFRATDKTWIIVGRNEEENDKIIRYHHGDDWLFEARDTGSPITLVKGELTEDTTRLAASITARYCRRRNESSVDVTYWRDNSPEQKIMTPPATDTFLEPLRI